MGIPTSPSQALQQLREVLERLEREGDNATCTAARRDVEDVASWLVTLCPDVPKVGENPLHLIDVFITTRPRGVPVHKRGEDLLFTDLVWDRGELELVRKVLPDGCLLLTNGKSASRSYDTWPITRLVFTTPAAMDSLWTFEALDWLSRGCPIPKGAVSACAATLYGDMFPVTWAGAEYAT